ncbi:MAG TPA: oxalurate catabolism protein HpxZ [Steroidobacteraceae bacterium]|nr:oxalurate catabolism protein HpxZ [Steroidobacteraceae bacterium]
MIINDPATVAEVTERFDAYERALRENDLTTLDGFFWDSPHALRYGVGENLVGIDMIRAFRKGRVGGSPPRTLHNTVITTWGNDFATTNTEFRRANTSSTGRQTQVWVRMPEGWRIVAGHVSMMQEFS